jgi:UDP-glucose 4-epimerase
MTGSTCREQHGPAKAGEQLRSVIDAGLLEKTFGWRPSTPLEDGLRQTVDYFRQRAH